jgi:hypothetical protein
MFSNVLFQYASISQWVLFLGIALILFGWLEKKVKLLIAGQILFLLLSLFAIWVIFFELANIPISNGEKITKELKLGSFFRGIIILGVVDLVSLVQKTFQLRFLKASYIIILLIALMLFFMVFNILQSPS